MRAWTFAAAGMAALSTMLATRAAIEPRLRRLAARPVATRRSPISLARIAAAVGAVAAIIALPLPWNLPAAALAWWAASRLLGRLESRADQRTRDLLARQAPAVADLLAATVASGATLERAVAAVVAAIGEPAALRLAQVDAAMRLGADPVEAWRAVGADEGLSAIGDAVRRSMRTGAPLAAVLARIADDLRRARQREVEVAARAAGVRAVAPLAACFLPAFMLLGVVPVVASLASGLLR